MTADSLSKTRDDIERNGFSIWNIFQTNIGGEGKPEFAFTVGLFESRSHPEIIVFGIDEIRTSVLHRMASDVMNGSTFDAGEKFPNILGGVNCVFRKVAQEHYQEYLGYALQYYNHKEFPAIQCVWPDKSGKFPWQPNVDERFRWEQALLFDS